MIERLRRTAFLAGAALLLLVAAAPLSAKGAEASAGWIATWACSPQSANADRVTPALTFADTTLRQVVHVSIGGKRLRLRFSNAFGKAPLTLTSAHVARSTGAGAIEPGTDRAVTFHGRESVTIPAGAPMVSDALDFDLPALSDVAVTVYLKDAIEDVTTHSGSRTTSYLQAGNAVSAVDLSSAQRVEHWYFINGIDVSTAAGAALVVLGDSITDGRGATTDKNNRWTDELARRLQANPATAQVAVLNAGIGGNRVLRDGLGQSALARLDRDVLAQAGGRWLIVFEGINDLGGRDSTAGTAQDLIAGYEQIILRARSHGLRVYGATITPCEGSTYGRPEVEANRQEVNRWIRTSGAFDAVIDFDAATRDPQHPTRLLESADSGDHLHPSPAGYKLMAEAVDLKLFAQ